MHPAHSYQYSILFTSLLSLSLPSYPGLAPSWRCEQDDVTTLARITSKYGTFYRWALSWNHIWGLHFILSLHLISDQLNLYTVHHLCIICIICIIYNICIIYIICIISCFNQKMSQLDSWPRFLLSLLKISSIGHYSCQSPVVNWIINSFAQLKQWVDTFYSWRSGSKCLCLISTWKKLFFLM